MSACKVSVTLVELPELTVKPLPPDPSATPDESSEPRLHDDVTVAEVVQLPPLPTMPL